MQASGNMKRVFILSSNYQEYHLPRRHKGTKKLDRRFVCKSNHCDDLKARKLNLIFSYLFVTLCLRGKTNQSLIAPSFMDVKN